MGLIWVYRSPICTGFGDRLGIIIALSALARLHDNSTVYMEWCTDTSRVLVGNPLHMKYIPRWTGWDYPLDSVRAHITLPGNVRFYPTHQEPASRYQRVTDGHRAPVFHGIPQTSTLYWKSLKMSDQTWSDVQYIQAYKAAGDEVQSLVQHASDYVLVHFRGMDGNTWRPDESVLGRHSFCTREVIRALLDVKVRMRVISNNYTDTMRWLKGFPSIEIVHNGGALSDLQLVLNSAAVVQHGVHGWSAYTSIPAMARSIPLINTYKGSEHRFETFAQYGEIPREFHTCGHLQDFLVVTQERLSNGGF